MRNIKRIKSILLSPWTIGVGIALVMAYLSIDYYAHRFDDIEHGSRRLRSVVQELHEKTIDWRMKTRGRVKGDPRVAILVIDDETLRLEGRWPWPRDKTSLLIDRTMNLGAKSLSFDMIFSEPDNNASLPTLNRLKEVVDKDPKAAISPALSAAVLEETSRADLDKILSTSIRAFQDNLILGSFSAGEIKVPSYSDICIDALYERSYPARYWGHESVPMTVIDEPLNKLQIPKDMGAFLSGYFTQLEVDSAGHWFESHRNVTPKIQTALGPFAADFDASLFPGLSGLVLNNSYDDAKTLLDSIHPGSGTTENVRNLFERFENGLSSKEIASLSASIRSSTFDYCQRFFQGNDELANQANYIKRYGDSNESKEAYAANSWDAFYNPPGSSKKVDVAKEIARLRSQSVRNELPEIFSSQVNIPILEDATKHTGDFNAYQDTDGSIRRARLFVRAGFHYIPSLAFKTFLSTQNYIPRAVLDIEDVGRKEAEGKILKSLSVFDTDANERLKIPTDRMGNLMINYSGEQKMFPHIPATEILSDSPEMRITEVVQDPKTGLWNEEGRSVNKREFLKDKILFLGVTAIGVYDLRVTPFDENYPGVETHANVLSNLLIEDARARGQKVPAEALGFLRTSPLEERVMWIVVLAFGLITTGLLTYFGSIAGFAVAAILLAVIYFVDQYVLFKSGIVIASLLPTSTVVFEFVGLTSFKYFTEERTKRQLKGTFEKYVSPSIVKEVMADPQNIELGGKKMELTVMFSDVRGFTTISEKLDPRALGDLLNSYLTPMTELVFEHKGTLDKYMGDAIMAFWGAPVHFPDHAKHAARCALVMLTKLYELQAEYRAKGLPEIDIGIGLNTGDMSVGNMGSNTVRSYTVMGDAVNLGSRLEGINKQYGTRIIVSEFTYAAIRDTFVCREIDWVKVKGKKLPVKIYELVAEGAVPASKASVLPLFTEGFALYHEMKFAEAMERFRLALSFDPNDAPSQLYVERCEDLLREPPPADWDGVFTMTSK